MRVVQGVAIVEVVDVTTLPIQRRLETFKSKSPILVSTNSGTDSRPYEKLQAVDPKQFQKAGGLVPGTARRGRYRMANGALDILKQTRSENCRRGHGLAGRKKAAIKRAADLAFSPPPCGHYAYGNAFAYGYRYVG